MTESISEDLLETLTPVERRFAEAVRSYVELLNRQESQLASLRQGSAEEKNPTLPEQLKQQRLAAEKTFEIALAEMIGVPVDRNSMKGIMAQMIDFDARHFSPNNGNEKKFDEFFRQRRAVLSNAILMWGNEAVKKNVEPSRRH